MLDPLDLIACSLCGKAFVAPSGSAPVCSACDAELSRAYRRVRALLRDHPGFLPSAEELAELLGIDENIIHRLVADGRVSSVSAPRAEARCRICRTPLRSGDLCPACELHLRVEAVRIG